jgi:hypothetical protein
MEEYIDKYHCIAPIGLLFGILVCYYYPLILFLLAIGVLGYFYVKSQEPIVERFYQSLVDNTVTRSPSQESQK